MEDAILIRRIKQGDEAAFDALVRRHYKNIYAFCYRRCGDAALAADLTQEVFLRLVTAVGRYSVTGKFTNYLLTIAVNVCNDHYRRKKPESAPLTEDTAVSDGAEAQTLKRNSYFRFACLSNIIRLLFPLRNPMNCATLKYGGMLTSMCMWSGHASAS